jgi:hypothetical protein
MLKTRFRDIIKSKAICIKTGYRSHSKVVIKLIRSSHISFFMNYRSTWAQYRVNLPREILLVLPNILQNMNQKRDVIIYAWYDKVFHSFVQVIEHR